MSVKSYYLSIRLQSDGFSLFIHDDEQAVFSSKTGKINLFKLNEDELVEEFKRLFETDINYISAEFIIENNLYTLVPDFLNGNDSDLIKFQHPGFDLQENTIFNKNIGKMKSTLIFGCPTKIVNAAKKVFSKIEFSHGIAVFLGKVVNNSGIFVAFESGKIDLAVVSDKELSLLNTYSFTSNEDILYHLLNIMYTMKLQAENRQLHIFSSQNREELLKLLSKHIPNTTIIQSNN